MVRRVREELYRVGNIDLWMAIAASAIAALMILAATEAQAQTFQVLHTFTGGTDGAYPVVGLTVDRAGNLYGTAEYGGANDCFTSPSGCGTVFKLSHKGSGWAFATLYSFQGWNATDGAYPQSRVSIAFDGSIYGATSVGGLIQDCHDGPGCGTVYRLQPPATFCKSFVCPWTETVLHRFTGVPDGVAPTGDLTFSASGNLYGTTFSGGTNGYGDGTAYELSPANGGWNESIIYTFSNFDVGINPNSGVIFDASGNLYGTASNGGSHGDGTAFQLMPSGSGWTGSAIYTFTGEEDGFGPVAGLIMDNAGNLYGGTPNGQPSGDATVFQIAATNGGWSFAVLHAFEGEYGDGPHGKLLMDASGNLYGTILGGSGSKTHGSVFKLAPSEGSWIYTDLHDFTGGSDGAYPYDGLIMDANGNLYGTTSEGGNSACLDGAGCGVVFEITP